MSADGSVAMLARMPAPMKLAAELPHNIEAEQALLGAIFINNKAHERVSDFLLPEHFAEGVHGRIYAAASRLIEQGRIANPVTLKALFDQDQALADMGGAKYLGQLAVCAVTVFNAKDYGNTIADLWRRRKIIEAAQEAIEGATIHTLDGTARDVQEILEQRLSSLHVIAAGTGPRLLADCAADAMNAADAAFKNQGRAVGVVATGLADLDRMLGGGLHPTDMALLAGRPSMGKSALAGTIALNASRHGHPVYLATPEMSSEQVGARALSARTRIAARDLRTGNLEPYDFEKMVAVLGEEFFTLPMLVDDTGNISLAMLRQRFRRFMAHASKMKGAKAGATPLLVIDYLGLMDCTNRDRRGQNRNDEITELSKGLKGLAKEFRVPVLALSQLSRAVEGRENRRPTLSDLRDSGSLEQDADVVGLLFRESYYLEREEPSQKAGEMPDKFASRQADWAAQCDRARNLGEVHIAKQRHGSTGKVTLHFDAATTTFSDLARLA